MTSSTRPPTAFAETNPAPVPGRWLAVLLGLVAVGGALGILLSDAVQTGHWGLDQALMPAIVALGVGSYHLIGSAAHARRPLLAGGFAVAFVLALGLTVVNSIGRQSEGREARASAATAHNSALADKRADLALAKRRLADAEEEVAEELKTGCGSNCRDWKLRAKEVRGHIESLERAIAALGGEQAADPKAEKIGDLLELAGFDRQRVIRVATLGEPVALAFLLELTAILAFGYGLCRPHGRPTEPSEAVALTWAGPAALPAPAPATTLPRPMACLARPCDGGQAVLAALLDEHGRPRTLTNATLAEAMQVSEGEASKRRREVAGKLSERRVGRHVMISLR